MKEVLPPGTPAVNKVLEQPATTDEDEKNAALNKAMAIVNEKIEGIASIVGI